MVRVHGWSIRRIGEDHRLVMVRVHGWSIRGLERAISSSWFGYMGGTWVEYKRIGEGHKLVMVRVHGVEDWRGPRP